MNKNRYSRLTALLLCVLLSVSSLVGALAETGAVPAGDLTFDHLSDWSDAAVQNLYTNLMACTTTAEMDALMANMTEEQKQSFLAALPQNEALALENKTIDLEEAEYVDDRTIVYPTVDFTNAAPFMPPVVGSAPAARMSTFALTREGEDTSADNGLVTDKTVSEPNADGVYTLTLEAYATGAKVINKVEKSVPTDIVLVLDQSGSMSNNFTSTAFRKYSGNTPQAYYNNRNNLYVRLSDGSYSPVTATYSRVTSGSNYVSYTGQQNSTYYSNSDSLYHYCNDAYNKLSVTRTGGMIAFSRDYTYTCSACGVLLSASEGNNTKPSLSNIYLLETTTENQYTFSYVKEDGTTETATVMASGTMPNWDFYESYASGNTTRLSALKSAVTTFSNSVAEQAKGPDGTLGTSDDVDHRIAIVGFASGGSSGQYNQTAYENTEIFVGGTQYSYTNASAHYTEALQSMKTQTGIDNINASIADIGNYGGTFVELGVNMANGIFNANPVTNGARNRVMIVFTDGIPGTGDFDDNATTNSANSAIYNSYTTKNTYGATVYTIGIFTSANGENPGTLPSNSGDTNKANRFMHLVSSNYQNATSMTNTGSVNPNISGDGYYLSASDSSKLTSIFKSISENIESGGSTITLDENAVVKDVLTDQFVLPSGTDTTQIKVYTDAYTANGFADEPQALTDANVVIGTDEEGRTTVSVSNFDYAENWVGTETDAEGNVTYRGKKLIIEIPIEVRDGFLGGNNVLTNGPGSGVYPDSEPETDPIEEFVSPEVNIALNVPAMTTNDKNIYLYGTAPTVGELFNSADFEKLSEGEAWKTAYVEFTTDNAENGISNTADTTVSITVTVAPDSNGDGAVGTPATEVEREGTAKVNVFKPQFTFKDSKVRYKVDTVANPDYFNANNKVAGVVWMNAAGTLSTAVTMTGTEPTEFAFEYALVNSGDLDENGVVISVDDIPVKVTKVTMGPEDNAQVIYNESESVNLINGFAHQNCNPACGWTGNGPEEFLLHVTDIYGYLTITKTGMTSGDVAIFYVDGPSYTGYVEVPNKGSNTLKVQVGNYTVSEMGDWTWRYNTTYLKDGEWMPVNNGTAPEAEVAGGATTTVEFNNSASTNQWLDGSDYVKNVFGEENITEESSEN